MLLAATLHGVVGYQCPTPRAHLAPLPEMPHGVPRVAAEVMTRAVVALSEDTDAAEAGRLMLEQEIKSIPVVRGRRVVGIVARRDLLKVLARSDQDIAKDLVALLGEELGRPSPYRVAERDGVVELTSPPDPTSRRLATLLARGVSGVVEVRLEAATEEPTTTMAARPVAARSPLGASSG